MENTRVLCKNDNPPPPSEPVIFQIREQTLKPCTLTCQVAPSLASVKLLFFIAKKQSTTKVIESKNIVFQE